MNCPINYFSHWSQNTKSYILSEIRFNIQPNIWSDIQSTIQSNNMQPDIISTPQKLFSFVIAAYFHLVFLYFFFTVAAWPVYLSLRQPSTYDWLSDNFKINLNPKLCRCTCKSKMHPQSSSHWPLPSIFSQFQNSCRRHYWKEESLNKLSKNSVNKWKMHC